MTVKSLGNAPSTSKLVAAPKPEQKKTEAKKEETSEQQNSGWTAGGKKEVRKVERKSVTGWTHVADAEYAANHGTKPAELAPIANPTGTDAERSRAWKLEHELQYEATPQRAKEILAEASKFKGNLAWQIVGDTLWSPRVPLDDALKFVTERPYQKDQMGADMRQGPFETIVRTRAHEMPPSQLEAMADVAKKLQGSENPQTFRLRILQHLARNKAAPFDKVLSELKSIPMNKTSYAMHTDVLALLAQRKNPMPDKAQLEKLGVEAKRLPPEYRDRFLNDLGIQLAVYDTAKMGELERANARR